MTTRRQFLSRLPALAALPWFVKNVEVEEETVDKELNQGYDISDYTRYTDDGITASNWVVYNDGSWPDNTTVTMNDMTLWYYGGDGYATYPDGTTLTF